MAMNKHSKLSKKMDSRKIVAFTLAEVLITLGIIGIVAAMTVPILVNNYQKNATVTKLKKTYTVLFQAIRLSESDNGNVDTWDYGNSQNGSSTLNWFNTYLANYLKYTNTKIGTLRSANDAAIVYLTDGIIIYFYRFDNSSDIMHVFVYLNGENKTTRGKDLFAFYIGGTPTVSKMKELRPYDTDLTPPLDRNTLINGNNYGCNKTTLADTSHVSSYCALLIMNDGWQVASDYPYFN